MMSKQILRTMRELRFTGGRFEQHKGWLDIDILSELQTYKKLIIETAKEEWKRRNPERKNLPKGFEENIHLGFHEVCDGSCAVPIERLSEVDDAATETYREDEVDAAAEIIDQTLIAARDDMPFPERLSARIIPLFEEWGKTLAPNEGIDVAGHNDKRPRFDTAIRACILHRKKDRYEDTVECVGEIRSVELKTREGGSFTILLENGESILGVFTNEQEASITEALQQHLQVRLNIVGVGEFAASGHLRKILRVDQLEELSIGETPFDPDAPPIWETIAAIGRSIPEEAWDNVPTDLAANLHHYLYGDPKENGR